MIEVVVSLVLLLVAILGLIRLQAYSLKMTYSSFQRSLAAVQAQDLVERMWAGVCRFPAELPDIRSEWQNQHNPSLSKKSALAQARNLQMVGWKGDLQSLSNGAYQITVEWTDAASNAPASFRLFTSMPAC